MKTKILLFCFIIFKGVTVLAQHPCKLYPSDTLKIFNNGSASVWGDFYNTANSASGGSLVINLGGSIIMYGDTFQNTNATKIGGSGQFEMRRPRPAPYASSARQILITGGPTVSFPSFVVNSTSYIELKNNDLRIRDSLKFSSGHLVINTNDLIVGNGAVGVITGYNENRFVVTNGNTRDTNKGYLIREQISTTATVFPVGQAIGDYTPASIVNNGTTDNFKVRVFDTVYENAYSLVTTIPVSANDRSVKRTWDIRESTIGGSNVNLTLQYNTSTEAPSFSSNRSKSFISHFTGIYPNTGGDTTSNWKWDMFKLSSTSTPVSPGTLTTGSSIAGASMKTRNNITSFSPFSITTWATGATPLPVHIINFSAEWRNSKDAEVNWMLAEFNNLHGLVLERSFDGTNFISLKSYAALSTGSFNFIDSDISSQMASRVFYRLKLIENSGHTIFSDKQVLKKDIDQNINIVVSPNPAGDLINIECSDIDLSNAINIRLINQLGQTVFEKTIEDALAFSLETSINTSGLPAGIYYVNIAGTQLNSSKKLIIAH